MTVNHAGKECSHSCLLSCFIACVLIETVGLTLLPALWLSNLLGRCPIIRGGQISKPLNETRLSYSRLNSVGIPKKSQCTQHELSSAHRNFAHSAVFQAVDLLLSSSHEDIGSPGGIEAAPSPNSTVLKTVANHSKRAHKSYPCALPSPDIVMLFARFLEQALVANVRTALRIHGCFVA
jgi:hypothetical protein